jgi:CRP/FNR family transcriptional regulator, cyclic AMP receptor protein
MEQGNTKRLILIEKILILKSLNLFKETPENILADLAPLMKEIEYEKDSVIFKEGETGDCMYIIHQGSIKIHKDSNTLAVLPENEVFGELSLLDADTRSATATANTDCVLFKIDQEPFYELMEERPEVAKGFIKILCQRLRVMNEKSRNH